MLQSCHNLLCKSMCIIENQGFLSADSQLPTKPCGRHRVFLTFARTSNQMATKQPQFCRNHGPGSRFWNPHETLHNQFKHVQAMLEIPDRLFPRTNSSWHFVRSQALLRVDLWHVVTHLCLPINSDFLTRALERCVCCVSMVQTSSNMCQGTASFFEQDSIQYKHDQDFDTFILRYFEYEIFPHYEYCTTKLCAMCAMRAINAMYSCSLLISCICFQWCLVIIDIYHQRILVHLRIARLFNRKWTQ